ncbi:hypothetical protein [Clostridioides sp. ZZV14-5902]|uniref:hypothetical protein n=1 Tax=Clostridioides sp. ZZV14-5902 TaxID=2811486 RepID=UPI001D107B87|nr:hypothetical protein [Clostridioides sp. ZZV14-5902]
MIYKDLLKNLDDIENLKEVENIKCTTNTGEYTIENSEKGYLTNFNIEGKTLVNLANPNNIVTTEGLRYLNPFKYIEKGREYTFINLSDKEIYYFHDNVVKFKMNPGSKALYTIDIDINDTNCLCIAHSVKGWGETDADKQEFTKSVIILEGDYTSVDIDYFEGLQSVGQGDNIKLFSCKEDINIIPNNITWKDGYFLNRNDNLEYESEHYSYTLDYIPVKANTNYTLIYANWNILLYDKDKNIINFGYPNPFISINGLGDKISEGLFFIKTTSNSCYMRISVPTRYKDRITISEGVKYDKKIIPYTLRSLPDTTRDEIIYKDNCYKLIQKCEELTLDGQSFWTEFTDNANDATLLFKNPIGKSQSNNTNLYCDMFKPAVIFDATNTAEGIYETSSNIWVRIFKNRLTTQNLEGFNSWLNNNKVTLVRPLKEHKEIDISSINLEQYDNKTKFICNSNIVTNISFECTRNLGSQIDVIKSSIKNINHIQSSPRIMDLSNKLLNGWKRTVSDNGGFIINKNGNQVSFHMRITGGATTDGTTLLKLPNGFIPKTFYVFPIFTTQNNELIQGFIFFNFGNGYLQTTQLGSNVDIYSYGTYFV